ncbi:MAG: leucine--tRNA ligase, partial [Clostridia bacterium]|nr:leucine--tRNA ligase [Clostridia bacterium]
WPEYDEAKTVDNSVEIAVQINGKLRATLTIAMNADKDAVLAAVKEVPAIASAIEGKSIVKEIYVPNKLANIVVK